MTNRKSIENTIKTGLVGGVDARDSDGLQRFKKRLQVNNWNGRTKYGYGKGSNRGRLNYHTPGKGRREWNSTDRPDLTDDIERKKCG